MTAREQFILAALSDGAWWFGLDLIDKSNGLLTTWSLYPTLASMEERGLIEGAKAQEHNPNVLPRRMYRRIQT